MSVLRNEPDPATLLRNHPPGFTGEDPLGPVRQVSEAVPKRSEAPKLP